MVQRFVRMISRLGPPAVTGAGLDETGVHAPTAPFTARPSPVVCRASPGRLALT